MDAVRITVVCDACVRIEYAPGGLGGTGQFCDEPSLFAIHGPGGRLPLADVIRQCRTTGCARGQPVIEIETSRLKFVYEPDGLPPHGGNMWALIKHACPPRDVVLRDGRVLWTPQTKARHNLGGTLSTLDGLRGAHDCGFGLLSRDGWALVDDSARTLLVDGWAKSRVDAGVGQNLDWYVFAYGEDYAAAFSALEVIAGRVPMPRKYALGSWYSRYWPYSSGEFRGIVDEFDRHDFPLDVLVLDMDWHKAGWTGWSWNRELLPDAEELIAWLHARGLAVTLNLHPADGVGPHEDAYPAFMAALGRKADGTVVPFDAGNRAYMAALFEQVHRPLEVGDGVDFWWVDWQQDTMVRSIPGLTNLRWLNHLYMQHTSRKVDPHDDRSARLRGLNFSRWAGDDGAERGSAWGQPLTGGWGDHRTPMHFSGDAYTGWEMLAFQVPFTVQSGNIGCMYWTHDIGGHFGPRLEEATTRWVQFGALSACLRLHSARSSTLDRRPWTYEQRFCDAMRKAYVLRARLMPTIYGAAHETWDRTLPLLRGMYIAWPKLERAYLSPRQYMLGRDVLCAPIVEPGHGERCIATQSVWFPPGDEEADRDGLQTGLTPGAIRTWHDLATGERHDAGSESIVSVDIEHVPVFVPGGVPVLMQPVTKRMGASGVAELSIRLYPGFVGQAAERELYEDDGLTDGYTRGASARTRIGVQWRSVPEAAASTTDGQRWLRCELSVDPMTGDFAGAIVERTITLELGGVIEVGMAEGAGTGLPRMQAERRADGLFLLPLGHGPTRSGRSVVFDVRVDETQAQGQHTRAAHLQEILEHGTIKAVRQDDGHGAFLRSMLIRALDQHALAGKAAQVSLERLLAVGAGVGLVHEGQTVRLVDSFGWIDGAGKGGEGGDVAFVVADVASGGAEIEPVVHLRMQGQSSAMPKNPTRTGRSACVQLPVADVVTPPVGTTMRRMVRSMFRIDGRPCEIALAVQEVRTPLTSFATCGPFDWDWHWTLADRVEGPERSDHVRPMEMFNGRAGQHVGWVAARSGDKWPVDLRRSLQASGGLGYCATVVFSAVEQTARLVVDASDKLDVLCNGERVLSLDSFSPHAAAEPVAQLRLKPGANLLLIKLSDGGGGWGFCASLESQAPVTHETPLAPGAGPLG